LLWILPVLGPEPPGPAFSSRATTSCHRIRIRKSLCRYVSGDARSCSDHSTSGRSMSSHRWPLLLRRAATTKDQVRRFCIAALLPCEPLRSRGSALQLQQAASASLAPSRLPVVIHRFRVESCDSPSRMIEPHRPSVESCDQSVGSCDRRKMAVHARSIAYASYPVGFCDPTY
jgi:hypothetical protein